MFKGFMKKGVAVVLMTFTLLGAAQAADLEFEASPRVQAVAVQPIAVEKAKDVGAMATVMNGVKTVCDVANIYTENKKEFTEIYDGFVQAKKSYADACAKQLEEGKSLKWYNKVWFAATSYGPTLAKVGMKLYNFGKKVAEFAAVVMILI